jgi:hypothetical protein
MDEGENDIKDLHLLVFSKSGLRLNAGYFPNYTTGDKPKLTVPQGNNYTLYAIANTGDEDLFKDCTTLTKLRAASSALATSISTWNGIASLTSMPLAGYDVVDVPSAIVEKELHLQRIAAKVTINIQAAPDQTDLIVDSYQIYNLPLKSYYIAHPLPSELPANITDGKINPDKDDNYTSSTKTAVDAGSAATDWTNSPLFTPTTPTPTSAAPETKTFYMFENRRGVWKDYMQGSHGKAPGGNNGRQVPDYATYVKINGRTGNSTVTWSVYLGGDVHKNFNIVRNVNYTYTIELRPAYADLRVNYTTNSDAMGAPTALTPANCFMVTPGNTYVFDGTIKGNGRVPFSQSARGFDATIPLPPAGTTYTPFVVWCTGSNINRVVSNSSVYLTYNATTGLISFVVTTFDEPGNAVIALKTNNGTPSNTADDYILWSWHIWKTNYNPAANYDLYYENTNMVYGTAYNTQTPFPLKMMQINLGATFDYATNGPGYIPSSQELGLLYQWGRKDPFFGLSSSASTGYVSRPSGATSSGYAWKDGLQSTTCVTNAEVYNLMYPSGGGPTHVEYAAIDYMIQHPTHFICDSPGQSGSVVITSAASWSPDNATEEHLKSNGTRIGDLWGNPGEQSPYWTYTNINSRFGQKSCFDPCPAGWRVPPADTWRVVTYNGRLVYYMKPSSGEIKQNKTQMNGTSDSNGGVYFLRPMTGTESAPIQATGAQAYYRKIFWKSGANGLGTGDSNIFAYWSSSMSGRDYTNGAGFSLSYISGNGNMQLIPTNSGWESSIPAPAGIANGCSVRCCVDPDERGEANIDRWKENHTDPDDGGLTVDGYDNPQTGNTTLQ